MNSTGKNLAMFALIMVMVYSYLQISTSMAHRKKTAKISFYEETIDISVVKDSFSVNAVYNYKNLTGDEVALMAYAPFPQDDVHSFPEDVILRWKNGIPESAWWKGGRLQFLMTFKPHEQKDLLLSYRQKVKKPKGRYILTTTASWGRPLTRGYYYLRLSPGCRLISSSYPLNPGKDERGSFYSFSRSDFNPSRQWDFKWECERTDDAGDVKK